MRTITAKFRSVCNGCKDVVLPGTEVLYDETAKKVYHIDPKCRPAEQGNLIEAGEQEQLADKLGFERRE